MKPRIDSSIPFFSVVALALFLPILVSATGSTGTSFPFRYSESDLQACVQVNENRDENEAIDSSANNNACLKLYNEFLEHYHKDDDFFDAPSSVSPRFAHFARSAALVHQHNTRQSDNDGFKLRLNQFADTSRSYSNRDAKKEKEEKSSSNWQTDLENFWEDQKKDKSENNYVSNSSHRQRQLRWKGMDVRLLDTHSSIIMEKEQTNESHQWQSDHHEMSRNLKWKKSNQGNLHSSSSTLRVIASSKHQTMVMMPGDGTNMPAAFSSPQVPSKIYGTEVELHKGGKADVVKGVELESGDLHKFSKSLDWSTSENPDGVPLVHGVYDQGSCGSCWAFAATGSVEASAARNTARDYFVNGLAEIEEKTKAINDMYEDDDYRSKNGYETMLEDLAEESRRIESETFEKLNLSIQELLDCDTLVDEGCIGGNPSLAFYYIHKYGLVPWEEYPYVGYGGAYESESSFVEFTDNPKMRESRHYFEGSSLGAAASRTSKYAPTCEKEKVSNPIATVESWGLLHKNHEALIEYALLYVGPVAVGINAADPSFINYGGGIFDSQDCDQTANHALLIVGYGEEDIMNQKGEAKTIRFWIARNSWGESWGEKGFVRVKRGSGEKGVPGVCGIARSPSIALGGIYRPNRGDPMANENKKTAARYRKDKYVTSYDTSASLNMYTRMNHPKCDYMFSADRVHLYDGCVKFSILYHKHQPMFLALVCFLCAFLLAIIPLVVSLKRQHRAALGNRSLFLEYYEDQDSRRLSEGSRSSSVSSGTPTERTHLLTLKDMYADARKQKETKRLRGRSIIMTSPEHDPFHLIPSSSFDGEESYKNTRTRSF